MGSDLQPGCDSSGNDGVGKPVGCRYWNVHFIFGSDLKCMATYKSVSVARLKLDSRLMESLYLLIPLSLVLVGVLALILFWSVKSGQFDDLDGPGQAVLMDDDLPRYEDRQIKK